MNLLIFPLTVLRPSIAHNIQLQLLQLLSIGALITSMLHTHANLSTELQCECACRGVGNSGSEAGRKGALKRTEKAFLCLPHLALPSPQDLERNEVVREPRRDEGNKVASFSSGTSATYLPGFCSATQWGSQVYMTRWDQE